MRPMKIIESRNKREGRYRGYWKQHIRSYTSLCTYYFDYRTNRVRKTGHRVLKGVYKHNGEYRRVS